MKSNTTFTFGSLINLVTLALGLSIGFIFGTSSHEKVHAQTATVAGPQFVDVAPNMTVGSIGSNLVLAHEVDADRVVVNGIDLLALNANLLEYLSKRSGAENADLENVITASKAKVIHRITLPNNSPQGPVKK